MSFLWVAGNTGVLFLADAYVQLYAESIDQFPIITLGVQFRNNIVQEVPITSEFTFSRFIQPGVSFEVGIDTGDSDYPETIDQTPVQTYLINRVPRIVQSIVQETKVTRTFDIPTFVQQAIAIGLEVVTRVNQEGNVTFDVFRDGQVTQVQADEVTITERIDREVQLDG